VIVEQRDALKAVPEEAGKADVLLCDLPCSGLGIIGKKPDIKYNISKEKMKELAELQRSILEKAVKYVKPGGFLIFSTCTVTKEENTANVKYITDELGLKGIDISSMLPEGIDPAEKENCYIQILPGEYGSDGFFISVFSRR
jgi:16S rRNA (cytosine967-C5)-methyltransferase